jgi:hypothetical protein
MLERRARGRSMAAYMQLVSWVYARAFAQAAPILPRWDHHLPPDAMHVTLQVLLAGTVVTGLRAVLARPNIAPTDR